MLAFIKVVKSCKNIKRLTIQRLYCKLLFVDWLTCASLNREAYEIVSEDAFPGRGKMAGKSRNRRRDMISLAKEIMNGRRLTQEDDLTVLLEADLEELAMGQI